VIHLFRDKDRYIGSGFLRFFKGWRDFPSAQQRRYARCIIGSCSFCLSRARGDTRARGYRADFHF